MYSISTTPGNLIDLIVREFKPKETKENMSKQENPPAGSGKRQEAQGYPLGRDLGPVELS